ncbi:MAG: SAM-dependent chlorinase/fluorinase [Gammaproteobacteria bacterium]|nr:SAM-dependent chlorinase/fluorinase [Gammaproteobacteria bacterium]
MLFLCTDFGFEGPYVGQLKAVAATQAPACKVIDLIHDLPKFNARAASYFVAAIVHQLPLDCIVVAVVDPGVGGERKPVVLRADHRWIVGPGNGLMDVVAKRAGSARYYEIVYQPEKLSASFHGRDLFMPVAVSLFNENYDESIMVPMTSPDLNQVSAELNEIIYVDGFGNLMTGLSAAAHPELEMLEFAGVQIPKARTFSDRNTGEAFFYENSQGLLEIAVNCGNAAEQFGAGIGEQVQLP